MKFSIYSAIVAVILSASIGSCKKDQSRESQSRGDVYIKFHPLVDAAPLNFTNSYVNANGEAYTIKTFKFYIHNIELENTDGKTIMVSNDHYLIDAADPGALTVNLRAATGKYSAVAFMMGVDSARNVSGAQTGALDPAKGMFWTWNSGYIMAKFEGTSPVSSQPGNRFEYHIGGFKGPDNVIKKIVLPFAPSDDLQVIQGKLGGIDITADANTWFTGPSDLFISTNPVSMTPGPLSKSIAENYYNMFGVIGVDNN